MRLPVLMIAACLTSAALAQVPSLPQTQRKPVVAASKAGQGGKKSAAVPAQAPLDIGIGDLAPKKEKILADAKILAESAETTSATQDYVRRYIAYSKAIGALGTSNWTPEEQALLVRVPEPAASALQLYLHDKQAAEQRVKDRIEAIDKALEQRAQQRLQEQQLAEQQRQAEAAQALREREVQAQERQAEAAEKQANNEAATADALNRLLRYSY